MSRTLPFPSRPVRAITAHRGNDPGKVRVLVWFIRQADGDSSAVPSCTSSAQSLCARMQRHSTARAGMPSALRPRARGDRWLYPLVGQPRRSALARGGHNPHHPWLGCAWGLVGRCCAVQGAALFGGGGIAVGAHPCPLEPAFHWRKLRLVFGVHYGHLFAGEGTHGARRLQAVVLELLARNAQIGEIKTHEGGG